MTDNTQVSQVGGLFNGRRKQLAMAARIPGLKVKAEGVTTSSARYSPPKSTSRATIWRTLRRSRRAFTKPRCKLSSKEELERQNAELEAQREALEKRNAQLIEQHKQVEANQAAIAANGTRFGQLDDYYIWGEVTVYFGNGQVKVDPKYDVQLLALVAKAKTVDGYLIEVKGYASTSGSAP